MRSAKWRRASGELSEFVMHAAAATAELVGFAWVGRPDAPSTFPDLQVAVRKSASSGAPLPVSNENTDSVIYIHPEVNLALRFWHDVSHVVRELDFTPPKELRLAHIHLAALTRAGFEQVSLSWRLLQADLVGQVYLTAVGRRFPADQAVFVERCIRSGIESAVLQELGNDASAHRRALALDPAAPSVS